MNKVILDRSRWKNKQSWGTRSSMTLCLAWCKADLETKNWRQVTYFGVDPKKYSEEAGNWDSNMRRASWDQKTAFLWWGEAENHCSVWGLSAWVLRRGWLNNFADIGVRKDLLDGILWSWDLNGEEDLGLWRSECRIFRVEGIADAKAQKQTCLLQEQKDQCLWDKGEDFGFDIYTWPW